MQPKTIELKQAPVMLVELPKGCKHEKLLGKSGDGTFLIWDTTNNFDDDNRPHGQILIDTEPRNRWGILGILSDLTEDQFAECVERIDQEYTFGYRDYTGFIDDLSKARHSFSSLLESEKVYTENPYGEKSPPAVVMIGGMELLNTGGAIAKANRRKLEQWQEAQSRTIDPKRTVVLLRKEGAG